MDHTLTIVARDPACPDSLFSDAPSSIGEGDLQLGQLIEKLHRRTDKQRKHNVVYRASTVADIVKCCEKYVAVYKNSPDVLQLVGHGLPGSLSLGQAWRNGAPIIDGHKQAYVLNSDPAVFGVVKDHVAPVKEVRILGCEAGATTASYGSIVDGPTFLFTLSRLWSIKVSGPPVLIGPEDFNGAGNFKKEQWLMIARGYSVKPPLRDPPQKRRVWLRP